MKRMEKVTTAQVVRLDSEHLGWWRVYRQVLHFGQPYTTHWTVMYFPDEPQARAAVEMLGAPWRIARLPVEDRRIV